LSVNDVFYKTWLDTYPNEELGITKEDIHDKFNKNDDEYFEKKRQEIINLPENATYIIAKNNEKVIGTLVSITREDFNEIKAVYVLPEYQGNGIGYSLWKEGVKKFDTKLDTFVNVADYNEKAIRFYERLGFIDTGERFSDERFKLKSGTMIPEMRMVLKSDNLLK